jgi:hypothetical protein
MKISHGTAAGIALAMVISAPSQSKAGKIDAVSGASIAILAGTTTTTGSTAVANVKWRFNDSHAGEGTCVISLSGALTKSYTVPASSRSNEASSATYAITGLAASSTYSFTINISERAGGGGHQANSGKATFTTDAGASGILQVAPFGASHSSTGYDAFGRRLGRIPASTVQYSTQGAGIEIQR